MLNEKEKQEYEQMIRANSNVLGVHTEEIKKKFSEKEFENQKKIIKLSQKIIEVSEESDNPDSSLLISIQVLLLPFTLESRMKLLATLLVEQQGMEKHSNQVLKFYKD